MDDADQFGPGIRMSSTSRRMAAGGAGVASAVRTPARPLNHMTANPIPSGLMPSHQPAGSGATNLNQ